MLGVGVYEKAEQNADLPDTFLRPFKVSLSLLGGFHAIREIGTGALDTPLSKSLELHKFTLFSVELAGTI